MVNRMRATRSHRDNRRSHFALKAAALATCQDCKARILAHHACLKCGKYAGKMVLNVQAKIDKKVKKAKEAEVAR
ncbi:MAG: 50S ribosomal protein L32 [Patescibacteria group bacterium]